MRYTCRGFSCKAKKARRSIIMIKVNLRFAIYAIAAVLIVIAGFHTANAEDESHKYGRFSYTINNDEITLTRYDATDLEKMPRKLVIPSTINGLRVVDVKENWLWCNEFVSSETKHLVLSDYMEYADMQKMNYLYNLEDVTLGKYTKTFCQDSVWGDWAMQLKEVFVPEGAIYLKRAKNGGIYSKDGSVLYFAPRSNKKQKFTISAKTKEIIKWAWTLENIRIIKFKGYVGKIHERSIWAAYTDKRYIKVPKRYYKKYKRLLKRTGYLFKGSMFKLIKY